MSALFCTVAALVLTPAPAGIQPLKFQISEEYNREYVSVTQISSGGTSTSSGERSSGQASFELVIKGSFSGLTRDSLIKVSLGGLEISRTLGSDPGFKDGGRQADLKEFIDSSSSVRVIASSLKLTWSSTHMTMKFQGKIPNCGSLLAESVFSQLESPGEVSGDGRVTGSIGGASFEAPFTFSGSISIAVKEDRLKESRTTKLLLKGGL